MAAFNVRSLSPVPTLLLLLAVTVFFTLPTGASSVSSDEYEQMQRVLRSRGFNLICNAMDAAALEHEILTLPANDSFTIFAPTDASLSTLNKQQTASFYTESLRLHVIPFRLSLSDLQSISSGYLLPTLLPHSTLRLTNGPLRVAGVDVADTGIFYSGRIAVHGLAGTVNLNDVVYYGGGDSVAVNPRYMLEENTTAAETEKIKAETEKIKAETEKIRAEAKKMRAEERAWMTHKRALCVVAVMGLVLLACGLVWGATWLGLIGDWLCAKAPFGNLKHERELERAGVVQMKDLQVVVHQMTPNELTDIVATCRRFKGTERILF